MNDAEYTIKGLRSSGAGNMPWTVFPREARSVVEYVDHLDAENARLQKENAYLKACVPPTKPSDYGHEAWAEALREAVAQERAAVVAYLRAEWKALEHDAYAYDLADDIERGDHLETE